MPGTLHYVYSLSLTSKHSGEVDIIIIPTLQVRKLRFKGFGPWAKDQDLVSGGARILI